MPLSPQNDSVSITGPVSDVSATGTEQSEETNRGAVHVLASQRSEMQEVESSESG